MLIQVFAALYLWAIVMTALVTVKAKSFLRTHPIIENGVDIEDFKRLARVNMYLALIQLAVLGVGIIVSILIIWQYGLFGLVLVLATNSVLIAVGKVGTRVEKAVRSLESATPELAEEHRHVSEVWVKKALPDF